MTSEEQVLARSYLAAMQALAVQVDGLISGEAAACEHPPSMLTKKSGMTMGRGAMELTCECGAEISMSWDEWKEIREAVGQE